MKNIIILGSKGNIGSSLTKYLKIYKKTFKVIGFDLPKYNLFKKDFLLNISKKLDKKKLYIDKLHWIDGSRSIKIRNREFFFN